MEAKLIQGVISAPLKDKKRFDSKRLEAQDANLSFHSSDEEAELDKQAEKEEYEELRQKMIKSGQHGSAVVDENDALAREAALKRMGHMAQNFNFYS